MSTTWLFKVSLIIAVLVFAASANASTIITYDTSDSPLTGFNGIGGDLVLDSTGGADATLTYVTIPDTTVGTPSNINYGQFDLSCPTCGTQASGLGTHFSPFTIDVVVTDDTDDASGMFVGTSAGGSVWSDVSQVSITWSPLELGPGTTNALSGNFGGTDFTITNLTLIVAPNSGSPAGVTTLQGTVNSSVVGVPEPATEVLVGGIFIALAAMARKHRV